MQTLKSKSLKLSAILLTLLVINSCASAPTQKQSEQVTVLQVLQRLDEFQNLVGDLYHDKQISPEHAVLYSKFTISASRTLKQVPNGWQPTVKSLWLEVKTQVPLDKMELKLQIAAGVLDTLLMGLK